MIKLSVNVNKVATLRNSRGGIIPSVLHAVEVCVRAGAPGITVHPRMDARHITPADVDDISHALQGSGVEYNIEGDPRPDLIEMVHRVRPTQVTLVPVAAGEITSQAGWPPSTPREMLAGEIRRLRDAGIRVSVFVDPDNAAIEWAAEIGADRVELYTEPFARAFERRDDAQESFARYARAAERARALGLGVNAGHDLDLENLTVFKHLPCLDEVSIGHALVSHALFVGLDTSVRQYLDALR